MKKTILITGASSGIGEYLAYAYAKKGYFIGLKLVRGAYHEQEIERAKEKGYPCPCKSHDTYF
mgnify:CR=1 FL=1